MSNFTTPTTQVNNYLPKNVKILPITSDNVSTGRNWIPKHEYDSANKQKRIWIDTVIKECGLRCSETKVIEALAFQVDPVTGIGSPSIGLIVEKIVEQKGGKIHYCTVAQALKRIEAKGAIRIKFNGKEEPNTYTLVGYEYKLEDCYLETMNSLNNPNIQDLRSYITYENDVSIINDLEKKRKPRPKVNTHIDNQKLKAEPEKEVKRALEAYGVDLKHEPYITGYIKQKLTVPNPGGYLARMLANIKNNSWNMVQSEKQQPIPEYREVEKAKAYEAAKPETQEEVENVMRFNSMIANLKLIVN